MLTDPGDLVFDPFAGSCVTGAVAERTNRKWVCCELSEEYLQGAAARFLTSVTAPAKARSVSYEIASPCSITVDEEKIRLVADGGKKRSLEKDPDDPRAEAGLKDASPTAEEALA